MPKDLTTDVSGSNAGRLLTDWADKVMADFRQTCCAWRGRLQVVFAVTRNSLADFIKAFSATLTLTRCQDLIERFEADRPHHEEKRIENGYSFTQLDVTAAWPDVDAEIEAILNACYHQYHALLNLGRAWPLRYQHEHIRLKRYRPGGRDSFPPHVDVTSQATCRRFCTAILYLNDPGGGGETLFPDLGITVMPEPGKLLMFPPLWTFPHAGLPPSRQAKYILHSYVGYPPDN